MPEWIGKVLFYAGGALVFALTMTWLARMGAAPAQQTGDGSIVLRYGRGGWVIGVSIAILLPAMLLVLYLAGGFGEVDDVHLWFLGLGLSSLYGWWTLLKTARFRVVASAAQVEIRKPFGASVVMRWNDIASVEFWTGNTCLVLLGRDGGDIRIPPFLVGYEAFVSLMKEKLPESHYEDALAAAAKHIAEVKRLQL